MLINTSKNKYNAYNISNGRFFSSEVKPIVVYKQLNSNKTNILKENEGKSGVYRFVNDINNKSYIGSSVRLNKRFHVYFSKLTITNELKKANSYIYRAILKYNYDNFRLEILEYCDKKDIIIREQFYIDSLKPEYNISKVANSWLGNKHTPESKYLMRKNRVNSLLRKTNHLLATGHVTTVVNSKDNTIKMYASVREAAKDLGVSYVTVLNYINKNKLLHNMYIITKKEKV